MNSPEKRSSGPVPLIIAITIVALVVSLINEAGPWQELGQEIEAALQGQPLEFLLDELNMVLMFLVFAGLIIWLFIRAARKELPKKYQDWDD